MTRLIREICQTSTTQDRDIEYIEIPLTMEAARQIFGPRVFDQLRRVWIDDDHDVVWVRTIGPREAAALDDACVLPKGFQFDFERFEYALITSTE